MKKRKRLFPSVIVALALITTIVLSQFTGLALYTNSPKALNETTVETVDELKSDLAGANSGDTIVLAGTFPIGNVTILSPTVDVTIDAKHLALDTSGWTINQGGTGTLTLNNFVFTGSGTARAFNVSTSSKIIINNLYVANRYCSGDGGAIFLTNWANVEIYNSTFHNNTVWGSGFTGGAIAAKTFRGSLTIQNSVFTENIKINLASGAAGSQGGAIYIYQIYASAKIRISDSYFSKNEAVKDAASATAGFKETADGGAIAFFDIENGAEISIDGSTFAENVAGDDGGAILLQTNDSVAQGLNISNSTFYKNQALGASGTSRNGGAIQFYANGGNSTARKSYVTMENNTFYGNSSAKQGGALAFAYAGLSNRVFANTKNSIFVGNTASTTNTAGLVNNGTAKTYNLGGNVGYDNNSAPLEGTAGTALDVFGTDTPTLHANSSNVKAGYNGTGAVPTLIILPDSVADNFGVENDLLTDARGFVRSATIKDSGAVEIGFLAFDANGGVFAEETPVTAYDGTRHTVSNEDGAITKVYSVSNIDGIGAAPTAPSLPNGNPFRGWSLTAGGQVLTDDELQVQLGKLTSGVTLFAVYATSSTVTVHHVDDNGDPLADSIPLNGYVGDPYSTQTVAIDGYTLKTTPTNATGLFAVENIEVTYIYSANPATVTVHHVDENGKVLASPVIENGFFGTDYTTLPIDIVGHTLKTTPTNATGLFAVENIEVTYIYSANPATVTVHHVDENGKVLASPVIENGFFGTDYTTLSLDIVGYTLKTTPTNATGLFAVENIEVTYIYEKVEEPTTEEPTTEESTSEEPTTEPTTNGKGPDTPNTGDTGIVLALTGFALAAVLSFVTVTRKRKEESD